MYEVDIKIGANQSKYWGLLTFKDKKGDLHEKRIESERTAGKNSNYLQALLDAVNELKTPCMLNIYTASEYVIEPFEQGWINSWEKNSWKNAKGNEVRNAKQWQQVRTALAKHSARFIYTDE